MTPDPTPPLTPASSTSAAPTDETTSERQSSSSKSDSEDDGSQREGSSTSSSTSTVTTRKQKPRTESTPLSEVSKQDEVHLTNDIWYMVMKLLPPPDLVSLACTSKLFSKFVFRSRLFKKWRFLCPARRKPLGMTWEEAWYIYDLRQRKLHWLKHRVVSDPHLMVEDEEALLPGNLFLAPKMSYLDLVLDTPDIEIIDFTSVMSSRYGTIQYIAEMDSRLGVMTTPRAIKTWRVDIKDVKRIEPGIRTVLPPDQHLVKPSGQPVMRGTIMWIDDLQNPLKYELTPEGIQFCVSPEGGPQPSRFDFNHFTTGDEPLQSPFNDFIRRWIREMNHSNQMFSAVPAIRSRRQKLYIYNVFERTLKIIKVRYMLARGHFRAPWILPMAFDKNGNLIYKILDGSRRDIVHMAQRSFDVDKGKILWSVTFNNPVLTTTRDTHLVNDHCFAYIYTKDTKTWADIFDLEKGEKISTCGPFFPLFDANVRRWHSHLASFHFIVQDRSKLIGTPRDPLDVCCNPTILHFFRINDGKHIHSIVPPILKDFFEPPRGWNHVAEDTLERYMIFQGVGAVEDVQNVGWPEKLDGTKKWLILDRHMKRWFHSTSTFTGWKSGRPGMHVLYRDKKDKSMKGMRFHHVAIDLPIQ